MYMVHTLQLGTQGTALPWILAIRCVPFIVLCVGGSKGSIVPVYLHMYHIAQEK